MRTSGFQPVEQATRDIEPGEEVILPLRTRQFCRGQSSSEVSPHPIQLHGLRVESPSDSGEKDWFASSYITRVAEVACVFRAVILQSATYQLPGCRLVPQKMVLHS
jgi:hypothetical protein